MLHEVDHLIVTPVPSMTLLSKISSMTALIYGVLRPITVVLTTTIGMHINFFHTLYLHFTLYYLRSKNINYYKIKADNYIKAVFLKNHLV